MNTLPVEELIGVGKNSKKVRGTKVFRRPPVAFAKMVGATMLKKRHRFEEPDIVQSMPSKCMRLAPSDFGTERNNSCSIALSGVASRASKADWYSPAAGAVGENEADHHFHAYLSRTEQWDKIDNGVLGIVGNCFPMNFRRVPE